MDKMKKDKDAKKPHLEGRITSMGFIGIDFQCPDCRTSLKFDDEDTICYCRKCGCKVDLEEE